MTTRTIEALRKLAERPGTPAEGIVAREKLKLLEAKTPKSPRISTIPLGHGYPFWERDAHTYPCACGSNFWINHVCQTPGKHEIIRKQMHAKFKKGDKVFYNYSCYPLNATATCWVLHKSPTLRTGTFSASSSII